MNEDEIKQACLKMMDQGWKILPNIFLLSHDKCCCPLTALAIAEGAIHTNTSGLVTEELIASSEDLANALKLNERQVRSFIIGFDRKYVYSTYPKDDEMYILGKIIREWWDHNHTELHVK